MGSYIALPKTNLLAIHFRGKSTGEGIQRKDMVKGGVRRATAEVEGK